jgi:hypothetical protein
MAVYTSAMARAIREAPGGMIFHVINRGVGRRGIFEKDEDYTAFAIVRRQDPERRENEMREIALDRFSVPAIRCGLREQMRLSALTDGARFTLQFETSLRAIWGDWCAATRLAR